MTTILISSHHEMREKVIYHPAPSFRIERHPGVVQCVECGHERRVGEDDGVRCTAKGEMASSGYSGDLYEVRDDGTLGHLLETK